MFNCSMKPTVSKITALCPHRTAQPCLLYFCPQLKHVILAFENGVWIILCGLQNYFRQCLLNLSFNFEYLLFSCPALCSQRQCIPVWRLWVRVGSSFSCVLCCFCLSWVTLQFILLSVCLVFLWRPMHPCVKPEWVYGKFFLPLLLSFGSTGDGTLGFSHAKQMLSIEQ